MTHAYKESYLNKAQKTLAAMMVYAVSDLKYEPDEFFRLFLQSGLVDEFGRGNPKYIAGKSGVELAREVILITTGQSVGVIPAPHFERSPVYLPAWAQASSLQGLAQALGCKIEDLFEKTSNCSLKYSPQWR